MAQDSRHTGLIEPLQMGNLAEENSCIQQDLWCGVWFSLYVENRI
jgi:hypothetical protein